MSNREVLVAISLNNETVHVGKLYLNINKGRESAAFEYAKSWLQHSSRFALEPMFRLTENALSTKLNTTNLFGAISDSVPDRWGRFLMRRVELLKAENEHRLPKTLFAADYLLAVNDEARQGALRFSTPKSPEIFLAPRDAVAIPPLIALPKLLAATERVLQDKENSNDLQFLLAPGSSLGGARPKASIIDRNGTLAIAKFPKKDDEYNVIVWEAVALQLAQQAGITVPNWRIERINKKPVLIIQRFDRDGTKRIPFLSAMSMLNALDNEEHSYLEIAYALMQYGGNPTKDLHELWRRIVFNIMIANTDDHLRNHGFLYQEHGFRLSPAYDMNPTPTDIKPRILTTAIDIVNTDADVDIALTVIKDFRLSLPEAKKIIQEVAHAVKNWRTVALQYGISIAECKRMESAFQIYEVK